MDERPVTRYATTPDGVSIAYQVTGDGPLDLVFPPASTIPIDLLWDEPSFVRFTKRLGSFSRTVQWDGRGMGASGGDFQDVFVDAIVEADLTAVLDAVGCERAVLVGANYGGPTAILYGATHPERVTALVLIDTWAHYMREDDYPWGLSADAVDRYTAAAREVWGTGAALEHLAPSKTGDEGFRAWCARCERLGFGVDQVAVLMRAGFLWDVRALLPTVAVPTLVLHREGNRYIGVGAGRYLGEHIPGATYVELSGADHMFYVGDTDALLDEAEEFLTGSHQAPEGDVIMAAVLFTDIVASTEQSARMGHRKWTTLTDDHDAMVRATLHRYRGREVKTIGDGFLATFDATTRALRAAMEIVTQAKGIGLEVRAGVHTGEVEFRPDDAVGLAVSIAKRICDLAGPGEVLISETVKGHIVGTGIAASEQGTHVLKGVPETWRLFAIES
ncbi:MAG: adenylate/guanylate cyclase domain-containing protein [Actinomycetota bacterium]|nr:adenylate/guanylate cyclase domain-containing protein [Actinomycetota bacterium]